MDSAALAESQLELQEERAALGLSNDPTPAIEVDEVDDWEVRMQWRSLYSAGMSQPGTPQSSDNQDYSFCH